MAKMMVRNYFKPNAPQNKCENVGKTLDGWQIWTVDQGSGLAVLKDGMLFRITSNPNHLEFLKSMDLMERLKTTVERNYQSVCADGSKVTFMGSTPSEFELIGRFDDWKKCRSVIEARKEADEKFRIERDIADEKARLAASVEALNKAEIMWVDRQSIDANSFEGLLKRHGVAVPPKTMGWIRKALYNISQKGYTHYRGHNSSTSVMKLANELTTIVHETKAANRK